MTTAHPPQATIIDYAGKRPRVAPGVFIAPSATLIGDVVIAARASIWFNCVLRGDDTYIRIGEGTNVQDGTVIHVFMDTHPTVIGAGVTIGHGAILHGCTIEDRSMIGIGAIVLDGVVVEEGAVVAAGAVVAPGKRVRRGEMWGGCPAKPLRAVKPEELQFIANNGPHYSSVAERYLRAGAGRR
ncbi:MAG: gamma carbonic anhydrase family protein [Pseudomonadota bacterium]